LRLRAGADFDAAFARGVVAADFDAAFDAVFLLARTAFGSASATVALATLAALEDFAAFSPALTSGCGDLEVFFLAGLEPVFCAASVTFATCSFASTVAAGALLTGAAGLLADALMGAGLSGAALA
jgi:hypothetical protein